MIPILFQLFLKFILVYHTLTLSHPCCCQCVVEAGSSPSQESELSLALPSLCQGLVYSEHWNTILAT